MNIKSKQWLFYIELGLRLSFRRVWVTQKLLWISLKVALDKTSNICKKIFKIEHFTSNISNSSLLSLILTEFQKSLLLYITFKIDSSFWLKLKYNNVDKKIIVGKNWLKK